MQVRGTSPLKLSYPMSASGQFSIHSKTRGNPLILVAGWLIKTFLDLTVAKANTLQPVAYNPTLSDNMWLGGNSTLLRDWKDLVGMYLSPLSPRFIKSTNPPRIAHISYREPRALEEQNPNDSSIEK